MIARLGSEVGGAFGLLTRLPLGRWAMGAEPPRCVWAYPLVGAAVGAIGAAIYAAGSRLGLGAVVAALWALGAMLLATGALHEDGLADTADAFGGGRTRARKLDILRDSRIGSYGTLALLLSIGLRVAAIASLPPGAAAGALVASGALGRGAILIVLLLLSPARPDGLGASLATVPGRRIAAGLALALALALLALPWRSAMAAALLAGLAGLALAGTARRQIGGYTGDVLGAASVAAECLVLSFLSR